MSATPAEQRAPRPEIREPALWLCCLIELLFWRGWRLDTILSIGCDRQKINSGAVVW